MGNFAWKKLIQIKDMQRYREILAVRKNGNKGDVWRDEDEKQ